MLMTIIYIMIHIRSLAHERIDLRMMKLNIKIPMSRCVVLYIALIYRKFYLINILDPHLPNRSGIAYCR